MNEKTKESKFLDAINRYAEKQKALISSEVDEYKAQKIEQATESGLKDAYELIQREISHRKAAIVTEYAKKEYDLRKSLYLRRCEIADEVFENAGKKLYDFTASAEYESFLKKSLINISEIIGDEACIVFIREDDMGFEKLIRSTLGGAEVRTDKGIRFGGLRALCVEKGILLDDTLDTRLKDQREWFNENSDLKVVG